MIEKVVKSKMLIDGTGMPPIAQPEIYITDGIIVGIGCWGELSESSEAERIDLSDQIVMPGLIGAHTHFFGVPIDQPQRISTDSELDRILIAAKDAKEMLFAGITSARCLGSSISPSLKKAIEAGTIPGPRLIVSGEFICSTQGTWDIFNIPIKGMFTDGIESMRKVVRTRLSQGATVIKVGLSKGPIGDQNHAWGDDPYKNIPAYSLEEIKALTSEAHANHLQVSAHCIGDPAVRLAIEAKVDTIEHGFGITEETCKILADKQIPVITTFSNMYFNKLAFGLDSCLKHIEAMRSNFEMGLKLGVKYVLGTDLMGCPSHPLHMTAKEFEIAVEWGMSPMQAIVSGTKLGAETLGMDDRVGTLEKGKFADLIGLKVDPLIDIRSLQAVSFVMKGGEVIL